ncbi:chemerin-like receptor 1 [Clarias gariepinus]
MTQDIEEFVQACPVCTRAKTTNQPTPGELQPLPAPRRPWTHIAVDFITGLPASGDYIQLQALGAWNSPEPPKHLKSGITAFSYLLYHYNNASTALSNRLSTSSRITSGHALYINFRLSDSNIIMDSITISAIAEASDYPKFNCNDFNYANSSMLCTDVECVLLATSFIIIAVLGIAGNGLVIWIAGFKIKKKVNTVWYLSLAVSDFLFCTFLSLHTVVILKNDWIFGKFMCKLAFFFWFLNWFNSILLLVIISVDRCVMVMFPIWARNKRSIRRALVIVLLAWITATLISLPAAIFFDTYKCNVKHFCDYFGSDKEYVVIYICMLIFLFLIPLLIIIICSVLIIQKLKNNQMLRSNRPFKIMATLIVAFFICWMPYHLFNLLELNSEYSWPVYLGGTFGIVLACANSFINPLLFAFMGKDVKKKCYELLFKIESTFEEEAQNTSRGMNITRAGDDNFSTTV